MRFDQRTAIDVLIGPKSHAVAAAAAAATALHISISRSRNARIKSSYPLPFGSSPPLTKQLVTGDHVRHSLGATAP